MHRQEHFYFFKNWYFEFSFLASQTLKLGSHRSDKVHHLFSLPEIDMVGTIKGLSSNLHLRRWVVRPRSKSFDIYRPDSSANRVSFLLCWKICKYEVCFKQFYFISLSQEITFSFVFKIVTRKKICKSRIYEEWNSLKNQEHFIIINAQQTFVLMKTSWRRLEDIFCLRLQKTSSRRLDQDKHIRYTHTSSEDFLKTSWSRPI